MENNTELKRKGGSDADPTQQKVRRTSSSANATHNEEESVKKELTTTTTKQQQHTYTHIQTCFFKWLLAITTSLQKMTDASGKMVHSREKSNYGKTYHTYAHTHLQ